jgi:adenylate cyclase
MGAAAMAREIERKFLVKGDCWKSRVLGVMCRQGYLVKAGGVTVRVRVLGESGFLTIKGKTEGIGREEYEYVIPLEDAEAMLENMTSGEIVEKIRYRVPVHGVTWDVDEFLGANEGLVLAEVELEHEGQEVLLPEWAGLEVTGDPRYYNSRLAEAPYSRWGNP